MAAGCIFVIPVTGDDYLKDNIDEIEKLDFPERLKKLVKLAHKYDKNYAVHGARGFQSCRHKYDFNPPAKTEDVRAFERDFDIKLPEALFRYLTEVGNGGAGVGYGVYNLDQIRKHNKHLLIKTKGKVIFEYENIKEKWIEFVQETDSLGDSAEDDIKYDSIVSEMLKGLLVIGTEGCTYDHVIVCEGKYKGMTGMIDWNLEEYSVPWFYGLDFESWICNHFKKIACGEVIKHREDFWTVKG